MAVLCVLRQLIFLYCFVFFALAQQVCRRNRPSPSWAGQRTLFVPESLWTGSAEQHAQIEALCCVYTSVMLSRNDRSRLELFDDSSYVVDGNSLEQLARSAMDDICDMSMGSQDCENNRQCIRDALANPTPRLSSSPTTKPTSAPTERPTTRPTSLPTATSTGQQPTLRVTTSPSDEPTATPTGSPSLVPILMATKTKSFSPSVGFVDSSSFAPSLSTATSNSPSNDLSDEPIMTSIEPSLLSAETIVPFDDLLEPSSSPLLSSLAPSVGSMVISMAPSVAESATVSSGAPTSGKVPILGTANDPTILPSASDGEARPDILSHATDAEQVDSGTVDDSKSVSSILCPLLSALLLVGIVN